MSVSNERIFLINVDMFCDQIPFVSTATNAINLLQKYMIYNFIPEEKIKDDRYYSYIYNKKNLRCVILLFPIIGNLIIISLEIIKLKRQVSHINDTIAIIAEHTLNFLKLKESQNSLLRSLDVIAQNAWRNGDQSRNL